MSALDKMLGRSPPPAQIEQLPEDEGQRVPTMQEKLLINVMKQVLPGLDLESVANMGKNVEEFAGRVGATLTKHSEALGRIEANQRLIMQHLGVAHDDGNNG